MTVMTMTYRSTLERVPYRVEENPYHFNPDMVRGHRYLSRHSITVPQLSAEYPALALLCQGWKRDSRGSVGLGLL